MRVTSSSPTCSDGNNPLFRFLWRLTLFSFFSFPIISCTSGTHFEHKSSTLISIVPTFVDSMERDRVGILSTQGRIEKTDFPKTALVNASFCTIPITLLHIKDERSPISANQILDCIHKTNQIWKDCSKEFVIHHWYELNTEPTTIHPYQFTSAWHLSPDNPLVSVPDSRVLEVVQTARAYPTDPILIMIANTEEPNVLGWSYPKIFLDQKCKDGAMKVWLESVVVVSKKAFDSQPYLSLAHELAHVVFNKPDDLAQGEQNILYPTRNPYRINIPVSLCESLAGMVHQCIP